MTNLSELTTAGYLWMTPWGTRELEQMTPYFVRWPVGPSEHGGLAEEELLLYAELDSGELIGGCPRLVQGHGHLGQSMNLKEQEGMAFRDWAKKLSPYYGGQMVVAVKAVLKRRHSERNLNDVTTTRRKLPFMIYL